jgi:predicted mannosyl-3-phosphoglycerate phosphatase (HAD superfamily)
VKTGAAYAREYTEGAAEWSALPETMGAGTTIEALIPGRVYRLRVRARTSAGIGDWSNPVVFLAL